MAEECKSVQDAMFGGGVAHTRVIHAGAHLMHRQLPGIASTHPLI